MAVHLLDINVLLALVWPSHEAHHVVAAWFKHNQKSGWATCPITQIGFVRILSNPAFSGNSVSPDEAQEILARTVEQTSHRFWPADVDYQTAIASSAASLSGHKQISDAYLVGLAMHHRGKFATLDQRIKTMLPEASRSREFVIEI
ncbi:MAG: VapC toxin family PIN domain ribonuclease [Acidobacteria bacterium]|nr:VapC toxin family PIN domain ribonuclease [Acidobacteriota bacterium]MBV9436583.1 VapC toxin family PIN domain ribonuclease [Acidobacteriota bacterium]